MMSTHLLVTIKTQSPIDHVAAPSSAALLMRCSRMVLDGAAQSSVKNLRTSKKTSAYESSRRGLPHQEVQRGGLVKTTYLRCRTNRGIVHRAAQPGGGSSAMTYVQ